MYRSLFVFWLSLALPLGGKEASVPPLNEAVLKFAQDHAGKQVGDGECWTLADSALASASAKRPNRGGYGPFQFGRELGPKEAVLPGDVVQFTKARFESKGGGWAEMPQHTAIISGVKGTKFEALHQNWNNVRRVGKLQFDLNELTRGKVQFYRPQPSK
jgi:hypothetical protein